MASNDVVRTVKVALKEVQERIPRNGAGDPAFTHLHVTGEGDGILDVFTKEQVVAMVNRYLYQAEYQQTSHKQYQEKRRAFERPIKEAAKRLFPSVSFINLTEQQLEEAIRAAHERKE